MRYRIEKDALGQVKVPADAYYGSETQRAIENFQISGIRLQKRFIYIYALLKRSAAIANMRTGKLDRARGKAIIAACNDVQNGKLDAYFVLDIFQAGAGTNTNMNLNEVIANRALEHMRKPRGSYELIHPNDHVNMSQSTNDTFHTVTHIAAYQAISSHLVPALHSLHATLVGKARAFEGIIKVGRTHLQDAVPMRLGQEFYGYAAAISKAIEKLNQGSEMLLEIPLGGTAIGTGINASPAYARYAIHELKRASKINIHAAPNACGSMQNQISELACADALKEAAVILGKISNDLRILGSGPRGGIEELHLPAVQPGSSIMPGKVNPSICEMLNMVCFQVIGNNTTISEAAAAGQLELNVFMPIIAYNLLYSINILSNATATFDKKCVSGITANKNQIKKHLEEDLSIATALVPYIGYAHAAEIATKAYMRNKSIRQICMEEKVLDIKTLDRILNPAHQV